MAICFTYIPEFQTLAEKKDYEAGALEGLRTRKKLQKKIEDTNKMEVNHGNNG